MFDFGGVEFPDRPPAQVLVCIANDSCARLRGQPGCHRAQRLRHRRRPRQVRYVIKQKDGRRNRYEIQADCARSPNLLHHSARCHLLVQPLPIESGGRRYGMTGLAVAVGRVPADAAHGLVAADKIAPDSARA